jgi:predicted nucleic acid-binding protein
MTTVLVDTNVLIALVDDTDHLHARAAKDLGKLSKADLRVTDAVLTETVFALSRADQRARLSMLLDRLPISSPVIEDERELRRQIFVWLARYADHTPDYADAELCLISGKDRRHRVWTYDSEFKTIWRDSASRRIAVVGQ